MIDRIKPYPACKESGVPWLGPVPKDWAIEPGFAAYREKQIKNDGLIEKRVLSLSYGRIIIKPEEKLRGLIPESFETYQIVEPGDIIIRATDLQNDTTSLRVGQVNDCGIITSAYLCLKSTGMLQPRYAYYLLHSYDLMKVLYGLGSGLRQNLSFGDFKRLPVAVPSPGEQEAIVRFLDHANRRIERFIRTKKRLIALLNEQKQAIIHRAVTRGLDPDVRLKPSGVPWLGDIPEHWELRRAKQVCSAIVDCKNRTPDMVPDGKYVVVRTTNVRHGHFRLDGSYPTDRRNFEIWTQRGAPRQGDVFFTREAPAGEACLVPNLQNLCMGQRMMYFRPNPEVVDSKFLLHSIYGPVVRTYIEHACNGSTVGHLRLGQVSALPLLWCPLDEQKAIVAHIERESSPLDDVIARAKKEIALLGEYRTRLIADVVTGKVDVREVAMDLPEDTHEPEPFDDTDALADDEDMTDSAAEAEA